MEVGNTPARKTIEELENELSQAQQALAELDKAQAKKPVHTLPGGKTGEAALLMRLQRNDAQLITWRAEIACIDAIAEQNQTEFDALRTATKEAEQQLKLSREALTAAQNKAGRFEQRMKLNRERRNQLNIKIQDLNSEQTSPMGNVGRSLMRA